MFLRRVKVWDLPVRVFSWLFPLCLLAVAATAGRGGAAQALHEMAGSLLLALVSFRIFWGFAGTEAARFSSMLRPPAQIVQQIRDVLAGKKQRYFGHSPLAGLFATLIIFLAFATAIMGIATARGAGDALLHRQLAHATLALCGLYGAGLGLGFLLAREDMLRHRFSGYKWLVVPAHWPQPEISPSASRAVFGVFLALTLTVTLGGDGRYDAGSGKAGPGAPRSPAQIAQEWPATISDLAATEPAAGANADRDSNSNRDSNGSRGASAPASTLPAISDAVPVIIFPRDLAELEPSSGAEQDEGAESLPEEEAAKPDVLEMIQTLPGVDAVAGDEGHGGSNGGSGGTSARGVE